MQRHLLFVVVSALFSCAQCPPTPTPLPPAQLDAAPTSDTTPAPALDVQPDPFAGKTFDCTGSNTTVEQGYAVVCVDKGGDLTSCLLDHVSDVVGVGILACGARDAEMAAFVAVDNGTASATVKNRAAILRAWFAKENLLLRSAP
jgi:hypothetical protein